MSAELDTEFANEQKVAVKRAMKGRPLYFGLQAKAAKSGKLVLSKKPGDVKPNAVKELAPYKGKDAEKQNTIPGGASMGVAIGENGVLTLHFERGKAVPAAAAFVKYFISRELKVKSVKKVVIAETDQLPAVPEKSDADDAKATSESVRERALGLLGRLQALGGNPRSLEATINLALDSAVRDASASDDALDDGEFLLGAYERLASLERQLTETAALPDVAAEVVDSIRTKRLQVARQQLDSGQPDEADDNLDVAEQSIANLRKAAGVTNDSAPGSSDAGGVSVQDGDAASQGNTAGPNPNALMAAFEKLKPAIQKVVNDHPNLKNGILQLIGDFQNHIRESAAAAARESLYEIGGLLKSLANPPVRTGNTDSTPVQTVPGKPGSGEITKDVPPGPKASTKPLTPIWNSAREKLDNQISALQLAMRRYGDEALNEIADEIEHSLRTYYRVELLTLLMEYDSATDETRSQRANRALAVVQAYRTRLASDRDVLAADDNPFDLPLSIQSTLAGAFEELVAALTA